MLSRHNFTDTSHDDAMYKQHRAVVTLGCHGEEMHEDRSHMEIAKRVAQLLRIEYTGRFEDWTSGDLPFCVPRQTLCGNACPQYAGNSEADFLGGWVRYPFMATKAIMHPLFPDEVAPTGWPLPFTSAVKCIALDGFTALSRECALKAGRLLLKRGDIRIKAINASGGTQQAVISSMDELDNAVDRLSDGGGLVLEENLQSASTYSVGKIRLGKFIAAYVGTQELTPNNRGEMVYGGSRLSVVRGGYKPLLECLSGNEAAACKLAIQFDSLADHYLGLVASRRNYDVILGTNAAGQQRCAVLEQSWRVGGATGAEIEALQAFEENPDLNIVHTATVERYGKGIVPPAGATIYYLGNDANVGPLVKYATLIRH